MLSMVCICLIIVDSVEVGAGWLNHFHIVFGLNITSCRDLHI